MTILMTNRIEVITKTGDTRAGKEMPNEYDGIKIFENGVKYFK